MIVVIKTLFIVILFGMAVQDYKTHTVNFKLCAIEYILSLALAILNKHSIVSIIVASTWLALLLLTVEMSYQYLSKKEGNLDSIGIGFGDIVLSPALTLYAFNNGVEMVIVSLGLSLVFNIMTRKDRLPLVPFFLIGVIVTTIF